MNTLIFTVDVEAFPRRSKSTPFESLILGQLENGVGGITRLMDIADKHDVKMSFMLDFIEYEMYGNKIIDAGKYILDRGHDLQLHAHPEIFSSRSSPYWISSKLPMPLNCNNLSLKQSMHLFDYLLDKYYKVTNDSPLAFRGGSYTLSYSIIEAMHYYGLTADCSYNPTRPAPFLNDLGIVNPFKFNNGVVEIPVPCIDGFGTIKRVFDFNFNAHALSSNNRYLNFLDIFFASSKSDVATLVMHSWSLSKQFPDSQTQTYDILQDDLINSFEKLIIDAKTKYSIKTLKDYLTGLK